MTAKRPILNDNISVTDFKDFYWLKKELVDFCKTKGINANGGKQAISERIITFLQTGEITKTVPTQPVKSKFDWTNEELTLDTVITDSYRNSERVRAFMKREIGSHFHFNVAFIKWIKENVGKTMRDAIAAWKQIDELKKDSNYRTTIAPQFEYNTYIRDFLSDNKDKTIKDAINCWKLKRNQRGNRLYTRNDLQLSE